ncbi:MAG TPA: hypothetical protein VNO43_07075 [Candidatus Eisenbacteria bacterium]|nr:hypothetical protein [Candidatus Eisenbacteria bacterium]
MAYELTKADLEDRARRAGLRLPAAEIERLLPGVNRAWRQAEELRSWVTEGIEPASVFSAARAYGG